MLLLFALSAPAAALAQTPAAQRGRLIITVADPSGAIVQDANVIVVGLDPATKAATLPALKTTDQGMATFDGLVPGRYSVTAEFPGFQLGLLRDIKVNRGDNKHVVVLPLKGLAQAVTVGPDGQAAAANRSTTDFGLTVSQEQIDALSDDPDEMQRQLQDLAGPDAIFRVDSFEGQQLPPKAQIKSIHVTRDQFAAETEQPGFVFVDVITQPGIGDIRGGINTSFQDASMTAKSPFVPVKGPQQYEGFGRYLGGALVKNKSNFSLSVNESRSFQTPNLNAVVPTGTQAQALDLRQHFDYLSVNALLDYTNHYNYYGYSGVMTSPYFMRPQSVFGTRSMNMGLQMNF